MSVRYIVEGGPALSLEELVEQCPTIAHEDLERLDRLPIGESMHANIGAGQRIYLTAIREERKP